MNKYTNFTKPLWWLMSLLTLAFVAGCGSSSSDTTNDKAITAYSLAGVSGIINQTSKTISVAVPYGTNVTAQIATFTSTGASVKVSNVTQSSATTANNFTGPVAYVVTAANGTTAIYTVIVSASSTTAKTMTSFNLAGVPGVINETAKTIAVTVPFGTTVSSLAPNFTATGASVKVATVVQTSGVTVHSFSSPVVYTVVAVDTTSVDYTVTVTVATNFAKSITAYSLAGVTGVIDETAKTITLTMPFGTNVTALVATFTSTGTGPVTILGVAQVSAVTPNNFTTPQTYTVVAANNTTASYIVTAGVAQNPAKAITAFSLNSVTGTINETTKSIAVIMPTGTNVTALVATFTTTGASVKAGTPAVAQISGTTANNFTSPVSYLVTAADTTTATYVVSVTFAAGPVVCSGAACVDLGNSAKYVAFGTSGITNVPTSIVTGNLGSAAAAGTITGFVKTLDAGGVFSTDPQVAGKIYAFDYVTPTPNDMTLASNDIVTAYGLAAGKTGGAACPGTTTPGDFSGLSLTAGVYKCTVNVTLPTNLVLNGSATDVWVFQFSGTLTQFANMQVQLTGGALPQNVFWQVAGAVQVGTGSLMQGVILGATNIDVLTGATVNGRLLAQTAVNLQSATVTQP